MADYVKAEAMPQHRDLLDELLNLDAGLTDTQIEFLDSLNEWEGAFTTKQAAYLEKIYEKLF